MPRPRKTIDYEEEIRKIDAQISKWKKAIAELQEQRRAFSLAKQEAELTALYQAVQRSGKSVEEVLSLISQEESLENAG